MWHRQSERRYAIVCFFTAEELDYHLIFTRKSGHPTKLHTLFVQTQQESNNSMPSVF